MKQILTISMVLSCLAGTATAQQFKVTGKCRHSIETAGNITLSGASVTLKNVSLTCDTLWIHASLKTLNIAGQVTIICNVLVIGGDPVTPLAVKATGLKKSRLAVQCLAEKILGRRPLQPGKRGPVISGIKPDK